MALAYLEHGRRVWQISTASSGGIGGVEKARQLWSEELRGRGYKEVWYVPEETEKELTRQVSGVNNQPEIRTINNIWRYHDFPTIQGVANFGYDLLRERPKRIIVNGYNNAFTVAEIAAIIATGNAPRLVQVFHAEIPDRLASGGSKKDLVTKTKLALARLATKLGARNVAVSELVAKQIADKNIDTSPVVCYPPTDEDRCQVKPRNNKDRALNVLTVSRVTEQKGVGILAQVARRCKEIGMRINFSLVGPSANKQAEQMVREVSGGAVEIKGAKVGQDLHDEYNMADVLFFPSPKEGFGLVTVEGLTHGLIAIARNGATREILSKAEVCKPGYVVMNGDEGLDVREVVRVLETLDQDREKLSELSVAAIVLAKKFDPRQLTAKFVDFVLQK